MESLVRRITGSVEAGVEHGSVVLRGEDGRTYQLGRRWSHLVGRRVSVTARLRTGMVSTAQQGTLVAVDEVADLGQAAAPDDV